MLCCLLHSVHMRLYRTVLPRIYLTVDSPLQRRTRLCITKRAEIVVALLEE